jgi:hypothetical protein
MSAAVGDQAPAEGAGTLPNGASTGQATNDTSVGAAGQSAVPSPSMSGASAGTHAVSTPSAANQDSRSGQQTVELAMTRGQDWALRRTNARAVPIRRTIRVLVRGDHLAILSDQSPNPESSPIAKTIQVKGDTVESVDDFVQAVQQQVDGWGTGGDGMYWQPVLQLRIAPDGAHRAQDLMRLLNNSGFELQTPATAIQQPRGGTRATH